MAVRACSIPAVCIEALHSTTGASRPKASAAVITVGCSILRDVAWYSWLHMNDNVMDPFHVQVLHSTFSGMLEQQMEVVARGGDPLGVSFEPAQALVKIRSGNFTRAAVTSS